MASPLPSTGAGVFVDTGVLLAADDTHNPAPQAQAKAWLQRWTRTVIK